MASDNNHIDTGRNLPVAFVVGVLLLGSIIASLAFNPVFYALLASLASFGATREMLRLLQSHAVAVPRKWTLLSSVLLVGIGYQYGVTAAGVWLAVFIVIGLIIRLLDGVHNFISDASAFVFVLLYIGFMISFSADLAHAGNGLQRVLSVVLLTAANDTGGYFAGIAFGRHPMVPSISPKKSWEGFAGSMVLQIVIGSLVVPLLLDIAWWQGAVLGVLLTFTATAGDLIESGIKRDAGAKDSGSLIPGHGGVLDRIDSHLINAPIAWAMLVWVLKV